MNVMLSKSFSLLFFLRKPKNYVQGKLPIYLRITINASRMELSTQRLCDPVRWNTKAGRLNGTKEEIRSLNTYLDSLQAKVHEAHRTLVDKNEPITIKSMKKVIQAVKERPRMILEIFEQHNRQVAQLVNKDFSAATLERYITSLTHTQFHCMEIPAHQKHHPEKIHF
jgi:hypothetical protein